jgi:flavin-dependent dehydrogenase
MPGVTRSSHDADVLVVGGGPGGSTAATFLAQGGLRVTLVEREAFRAPGRRVPDPDVHGHLPPPGRADRVSRTDSR